MIRLIYPGENKRRRGQVMGMQEPCLDIQKQWHKPNPSCQTFCYPYYTMAKGKRQGKRTVRNRTFLLNDSKRLSQSFIIVCCGDETDHSKIINPNSKQQHFFPLVFWHLHHRAHLAILSWFGVTLDSASAPVMQTGLGNAGSEAHVGFPPHCVRH